MRVSFIIPLYNCLPLTQAMLASLQATLPAGLTHEIILVDDGSTDGTREWLKTLTGDPFRVVFNARNLGYAGANNRAAALARGEFLALLNNDLVLQPRWLEPMLRAHRRLGARAGLVGNVQLETKSGAVDHAGIVLNANGKPEHLRVRPNFVSRLLRPARVMPAPLTAIERVTLGVKSGEFLSIVGPSGCGKSTILNLVAGLDRPSEGTIVLNGVQVDRPNPSVGFMLQKDLLLPWRTIVHNVEFGLEARGLSTAETKMIKYVEVNAQKCGIPEQAHKQLNENHAHTTKLTTQVCNVAAQQAQAQQRGPAGPSLSDVLGSPALPEARPSKRGGGSTFDTLSGNVLAR